MRVPEEEDARRFHRVGAVERQRPRPVLHLRVLQYSIYAVLVHDRTTTAATDHVPKELAEPETKPLEEVKDIITLPEFHQTVSTSPANSNLDDIQVSIETVRELRMFVTGIANMYRDNSFHNFDHASVSFIRRLHIAPLLLVANRGFYCFVVLSFLF